jgi:tetratricopeptide (TPR) repeat protein
MRRGTSLGVRVAASAALLSVMAATFGLAWGMRSGRPRPGGQAAPQDMASAHAAAGVETSEIGAVQSSFHEQVEAMRAQVAATPDDPELALSLAHLLHDGHRPSEAAEYYEAAIDLDPGSGQAYYDLALAYTDEGGWEDAAAVLQRRLDAAPDDAVAMYDLGAVSANLGDRDRARMLWTAALNSSSPPDPELRQRTERALAQLGGLDPP